MNSEQEFFIRFIQDSSRDSIIVKETGREEIVIPMHSHDKDQIIFTTSGTLRISAGEKDLFVPEHHITFIPRNTGHTISSNNRQVSATIVYCTCGNIPDVAVYQSGEHIAGILKFIQTRCPQCIEKEAAPKIHKFLLSFIEVIPFMCRVSEIPLTRNLVPEYNRIRPVLDYIAEHCNEELRISDIARNFGFSERNLSRLFKQAGIRFTNCVNTHRITRAIELMSEGKIPVREIAYSVGFNTPSGFNRVFKQITGRSPGIFVKTGKLPE